jgi:hypothetical protein
MTKLNGGRYPCSIQRALQHELADRAPGGLRGGVLGRIDDRSGPFVERFLERRQQRGWKKPRWTSCRCQTAAGGRVMTTRQQGKNGFPLLLQEIGIEHVFEIRQRGFENRLMTIGGGDGGAAKPEFVAPRGMDDMGRAEAAQARAARDQKLTPLPGTTLASRSRKGDTA